MQLGEFNRKQEFVERLIVVVGMTLVLAAFQLLAGCAPRLESISARDPGLFDKAESGPLEGYSRPIGDPVTPPELYVRHKEVKAKPSARGTDSGSLYNADDERNYFFAAMLPRPGSSLVIRVATNRKPESVTGGAKSDKSPKTDASAGAKDSDVEDTLIKALPELAPADKNTALISQFQAEVTHIDESGNVFLLYRRRSMSGDQAHEIRFHARVPFSKLETGEQLTTNDLVGVEWVESSEGQIIERKSAGWEDEYSMRLSGFDEARSKAAMALEEKRKQLLDVRNRLDTRLKTFAEERQQMAKQREELLAKDKEKETRISELQGTVEQQRDEIERLKPAENSEAKLGDSKDGKNGKK